MGRARCPGHPRLYFAIVSKRSSQSGFVATIIWTFHARDQCLILCSCWMASRIVKLLKVNEPLQSILFSKAIHESRPMFEYPADRIVCHADIEDAVRLGAGVVLVARGAEQRGQARGRDQPADLAGSARHRRGRALVFVGVATPDRDVAAGSRQRLRDAKADAAIATGDDGHAAGEVENAHRRSFGRIHWVWRAFRPRVRCWADGSRQPWTSPP